MNDGALIGFLTVIEVDEDAWDGAYLITDLRGNPSRFCRASAPVRLTRLQRILLGRGIRRHVFSDLIGKSLVDQAGGEVAALVVDVEDLLALRETLTVPTGFWSAPNLTSHPRFPTDRQALDDVAARWDLIDGPLEVFERLREALREPVATDGEG